MSTEQERGEVMEAARKRKRDKLLLSFLQELVKLKPEEGAGIATLLNVQVMGEKGESFSPDVILNSFCKQFAELTTKRKKEVIKLMKQARR